MAVSKSTLEMLVGIDVRDDDRYGRYREAMVPILKEHGGFFRYDFRIEKVLQTDASHSINRLFIISFPNASARDAFFINENYLRVRGEFFEAAVEGVTMIAEYETIADW